MTTKFFFCKHCGNVVVKVVDSGVVPVCCGESMVELVPNLADGVGEKHLPVIQKINDCTVRVEVGLMPHPHEEKHHISFLYLETENGGQLRYLDWKKPAEAFFCGCKDKITAVYAYCNIHGLWRVDCKGRFDDLKCGCDDEKSCTTGEGKSGCCSTKGESCSSKGESCSTKVKGFFGRMCK